MFAKHIEALRKIYPHKENMSRNRIVLVTVGIMLSLFLASMESTIVAAAMPTIVGQLGGLENYSWVFSAFMLASTTTVPLYGKLSDIYGRRNLYVFAMTLFLLGSLFCGMATTLTQLILARALYEKVVSNIQEVKARKGKIIAIVTEGDTVVKDLADHVIEIPDAPDALVPLLSVVPLQLISYHIAVMRGCNVDQPRNLAKSVTVE